MALIAFQKKSEFGPAIIKADNVQISKANKSFNIEVNSTLTINGKNHEIFEDNIKEIIY